MKAAWFEQQGKDGTFESDELAEQADAYEAAAREDLQASEEARAGQLEGLREFSDEYTPKLADALEQIDGEKAASLKEQLAAWGPAEDYKEVAARVESLESNYAGLAEKAFASLEVDRDALLTQFQWAMGKPELPADLTVLGGSGGMALTVIVIFIPFETEPGELTLRPAYGLQAVGPGPEGVAANAATGQIRSDTGDIGLAGSVQRLASVGSLFRARSPDAHIRVETTVNVDDCFLYATGLGYFSSEALLNLKVLDGARVVASDRRSLAHTAVSFWQAGGQPSGRFTLACELDRRTGSPANFSAVAEAETWAGGGGLGSARADLRATVEEFRVYRS